MLRSAGLQRRHFVTLTDACRAIGHLLELPAAELGDGLFNVGGGWSPTILEMTEDVAARIHADYRINRLIGTGFNVSGDGNVDQEIDRLIWFCFEHAT